MNAIKKFKLLAVAIFAILTAAIVSCNSEFDRVISEKQVLDTASVRFGTRKVLYLIVDGARGESVLNANIPNINGVLNTSIASWVALNDPTQTADVTYWADMLTGVKQSKHKVVNDALTNNNLQNYPVIFQRIKEINPRTKIVSYTPSPVFKSLTVTATVNEQVANDDAVKTSVINTLKNDTASLVVGHFMDVDKAGTQFGYDNSFPQYKSAIEKFDSYVGEILTALKARVNYKNEDWLVIIASNGGGQFTLPANQNDQTVFSNTQANSFIVYYSLGYKKRVIAKPFTGNRYVGRTVRLKGQNVRAEIDTADVFNINDTTVCTIELKVKKNADEFYWPSILGKRGEWSGGGHPTQGWVIYLEGRYWYFEWRGSKNGDFQQCRGQDLVKGRWENLTAKIEKRGNQRFVRTYTNGVFNNEVELSNDGALKGNSLANNNKLKLGFLNGNGHGEPDVYVSDIRYFKTAVPDATISNYACATSIDQSHPYYSFIAGYWPATDGNGAKMVDLGPQARDFKVLGSPTWESFNDIICPPSATSLAVFVPQTSDIPSQILNWFKIATKQAWALDGRVWLDQ